MRHFTHTHTQSFSLSNSRWLLSAEYSHCVAMKPICVFTLCVLIRFPPSPFLRLCTLGRVLHTVQECNDMKNLISFQNGSHIHTHTAREGRKQEEHTNVQINTIVFEGERGRETKTEWAQLKLKTTWAERKNAKRQTEDVYVCTRVGQINQTKNGKGKMTRRVVDMLCLYLTCHYSNNWRMNRIEIRLLKKKVPKTRNILMALSLSLYRLVWFGDC